MIRLKRAYEAANSEDGVRILVDRLWPRGVSKDSAQIELWLKDVAPTPELRTWFNHDPAKWDEFYDRYTAELKNNPALENLHEIVGRSPVVTLVYGAKDLQHNHAIVLRDFLEGNGR